MTDQDNLRDRIRDSILAEYQAVENEREFGRVNRISDFQRNIAERYAQAIIDELELTIETHAATQAKRNMTRITGAWEWEKQ